MPADWYYVDGDRVVGPLTTAELRDEARDGRLTRDTPVREGRRGEWQPARQVLGHSDRSAGRDSGRRNEDPPIRRRRSREPGRRPNLLVSLFKGFAVIGAVAFAIYAVTHWDAWQEQAARRPEVAILGRWDRVSSSGVRHTAAFHKDGVAEFDGQAKDEDFMRHVRYQLVDDHTLVFRLTEVSLRSVSEHYPDVREGRKVMKVGDEIMRLSVTFPSKTEMVMTALGGERTTWKKQDAPK